MKISCAVLFMFQAKSEKKLKYSEVYSSDSSDFSDDDNIPLDQLARLLREKNQF